jgi:hypothetical protein
MAPMRSSVIDLFRQASTVLRFLFELLEMGCRNPWHAAEFPLSRQLLDDFDRENLFGQLAENRGVFETLASSGSLMARHFQH